MEAARLFRAPPVALLPTLVGVREEKQQTVEGRVAAERTVFERQIVERAQAGDQAAFAQLVERYSSPILSICYASVLNPADAEDLAQDVFLAAWRSLRKFRGEATFSTWLFALARNRCIDRSRRVRTRPQLVAEDEQAPAAHYVVDVDAPRLANAVLQAAGTLSVPLRQALLLRDIQGLSYEEIADLQDVPVGTVRSRIAAARASVAERSLQ